MKNEIIISIAALVLFSCKSELDKKDHAATSEKGNYSLSEESSLKNHLTLNNGAKWKTDESTRKNVEVIQEIVETIEREGIHTINEYNEAGKKIQDGTDGLIRGCRMTGKEHEMLHEWLMPLLDDIKLLTNAAEIDNAERAFLRIDQRLHRFNLFFE